MNRMKKVLSLLSAFVFAISMLASIPTFADTNIEINEHTFPDAVFREAVSFYYDTDHDGSLSAAERNVTAMLVSGIVNELEDSKGLEEGTLTISTLEGIEYFENLKTLRCNNIGELGTLDVSALTKLETLNCSDDGLTSLDLSANTALKNLHCCSNEFTSLDFSANSNLEVLHCYSNLELASLNVNSLSKMEDFRCDDCRLTTLDLSTNTALYKLNCSHNRLSSLDLSSTSAASPTAYHLGNQSISLELIYEDGLIKAPIELDENAVYSTSLDGEEKAYSNGAFFTDDYSKIENGFSYLYSTGKSGCAEMEVSVSVSHSHTYSVTAADYENNTVTINCDICGGDEHTLSAEPSTSQSDADCTTAGTVTKTLTAIFDGETYTASQVTEVDALGHNYNGVVTNPTCTEQGYTTYTCTRCNDSYVDDYTDALGHLEETIPAVAATCTESGLTAGVKCSRCNEILTAQQTVDALGHDEETIPAVAPTCTESGLTAGVKCSRCNEILTAQQTVNALGHDEETIPAVAPTCTESGLTAGVKCSRCNEILTAQQTVNALGHDFGDWRVTAETILPTCTQNGVEAGEIRTCSRCTAYETRGGETLEALGHDYAPVVTNPTCTEQGYTTYTCTRCNDSYVADYTDALGHIEETIPAVAATCTQSGLTAGVKCSRCNEILTAQQTVEALGHTSAEAVVENRIEPTCTAAGSYDEVVYCSVCSAEISRETKTVNALGHDFGEWRVTTAAVAPTCTENGANAVETRYCSRCDETETRGGETLEALGHDYASVVTNPTCTEQGYTTYTCTRCTDSYVADYTNALGHTPSAAVEENRVEPTCKDFGSYDTVIYCSVCEAELSREPHTLNKVAHTYESAVTEPTCTEQGFTTNTCSVCGFSYKSNIVAALGHDWDEGVVTVPATEESEGTRLVTCTRCNETETRTIPKLTHVHSYTSVVANPTCTEQGFTTYTCAGCGDEYTSDYVDALGHTPSAAVEENRIEPTCTEAGSFDEVVYCSVCEAELSREAKTIDALGHNYSADVTAPSCTEGGYTTYTCTRCTDSYVDDYTDALGHDFGDWTVTTAAVAPTCTENGANAVETRYCSRCDETETRGGETVEALGHTNAEAVKENETQPTCTAAGSYDEVVYCSVCSAELSREAKTVDALGHDFGDWTVTTAAVAPTCTENGANAVDTRYCSRCNETETRGGETIAALGHIEETIPAVAPTCTESGLTEGAKCSRCGEILTAQQTVEALGHTSAEAVKENEIQPTCTAAGSYDEVVYCSVCSAEISRETKTVDALGHDFGDWTVTTAAVAPTCTEAGANAVETRACSRCDETETRGGEAVEALGHDYAPVVTAPTCTANGYTTFTCSRCNDSYTADETAATGHQWNDGEITVQPTVDSEGKMKYTCTVCGEVKYEVIPKADIADVTPSDKEADDAKVNKKIKKPSKIRTVLKPKTKQFYITFGAVSGAQNYRVMYRKQGAKKWTKAWTNGKTEFTIKKLKTNGLYEFKFAAYKKNASGKWERGEYSTTSYRLSDKAKITKATVKKNTVTVNWKRNKTASYYTVEYATNRNMKNSKQFKVSPNSKTSYKIKGLKKGKKYFIRVRAMKKKGGKTYVGGFSDRKVVTIK